ncbi:hypothetical protein [Micromonospora sp. CB01531]|uniref:hypothetical protein n=1 Tax=Micromonospora sp. CB01531 TaxID=1718947 RepID=UPI000AABBAAA|nr:hypothetical protein [Micromonospora sp. CB01531]
MVSGEWVTRKGQRVWQEWRPTPCLEGHDEWSPGTTGCPDCRWTVRYWRCRECGEVVYDPDHQHGT